MVDSKTNESIFLLEHKPKNLSIIHFFLVRIYALEKLTNILKSERISLCICVCEKYWKKNEDEK